MVGQKPGKNEGGKQADVKAEVNQKMEAKTAGNQKNEDRKNDHGSGGGRQHGPGPRRGQYRNRPDRKQHHQQHGHSQDQHQDMNLDQTMDLEQMGTPASERKFTGRCRLFVGNLTNDIGENEFKKMFEQYGEFSEVFINPSRGFGFIKMDTRANAEIAKAALDGQQRKGRVLRVRFATHGAALRVKYLPSHVSNELLEQAFSQFGDVERAIVIVDDRGRPTGEGIVEFARKPGAQQALSRINDGVFILGTTPRPIIVEPLDQKDEEDGYPEKFVPKNQQVLKEREQPPRFAPPGSFEYEFAQKWKDLYQMEVQQKEQLKRQMEEAAAKVDLEMESAQHEHQTMLLRQDLLRRQEELRRLEEQHQNDLQRKLEMRRQEEEMRIQNEERRRQEIIMRQQQEEEMRRRQLDRGGRGGGDDFYGQERSMRDMGRDRGNAPPMQPPPAPPASLGLDRPRNSGMGGPGMGNQGGPGGMNNLGGHGGPGGMSGSGMGGQQGMGMNQQPTRQSRFDQPPQTMGGFGNMGGGPGGNMGGGGPGNMGNMGGPGGNMMGGGGMGNSNMNSGPGGMSRGHGPMNNERMMDRRDRDDYFENKRPRRF